MMRLKFVRPLIGGIGASIAALVLVSRGDNGAGLGAAVLALWCWAAASFFMSAVLHGSRHDRNAKGAELHRQLIRIYAIGGGAVLLFFVIAVWVHIYAFDSGTYRSVGEWSNELLIPAVAPSATVALVGGGALSFALTPFLTKKSAEGGTH